jgi:hypothetical protein
MLTVYKRNNSHCLKNSLIHSEVTTFIVPVISSGKPTHQTVCRVYVTTWEPTATGFNHPPGGSECGSNNSFLLTPPPLLKISVPFYRG